MQSVGREEAVLDGSDIVSMVENEEQFHNFVENKFQKLDRDGDGELSVKELQPAVADIGAALGLPAQGASPDSDNIYKEVLNEFTHGKGDRVSKTEFKQVLSDILLGVAAGLKRDPIVILRMDGQDLSDFIRGPSFEIEMINIFSKLQGSLADCITMAFENLTVDQGMPPSSDPWVQSNLLEPALQQCATRDQEQQPLSQETFLEEFKKVAETITQFLSEQPIIVAHTDNTFDGSGIKRLLSNKFELDKTLDAAISELPKDRHRKLSKEYLRVALDTIASIASLPPYGAVDQMDKVVNEVFKMVNADDGKLIGQDEFKKLMIEILASIMLQLQGNPVSVSSNSVVHEPISFSSTSLLTPVSS
ncbi:hypothetical protein ACHQM5_024688 [Ranunculus cassubicifolius]